MVTTLFTTLLALSSYVLAKPVQLLQNADTNMKIITAKERLVVDKPSNFHIPKDLDKSKALTPDGKVVTRRYGYVQSFFLT